MRDHALVIGLDAYHDPAWELRAAVRDALAFAKWVTAPGAGRATPETLTLLLSPHADRPVKDVKFNQADYKAIHRALYDHTKLDEGVRRLWFFYAGHGIAPAGGAPDAAPVIVPSDVDDLDYYRYSPIDLGSWIREMQVYRPEQQVYFVDACRGLVVNEDVVTATKMLFFDLSKMKRGEQAQQAVLFATTAGQLANEQGLHGLFGGALMEGLRGTGPALEADADKEEFVLTFGGLAEYTKRRIRARFEEARRNSKILPTQEPAESLFRAQSSLELARFKDKPRSLVKVFVEPESATQVGTAGIRGYNDWKRMWERQAEKPSPLAVPIEWELSSSVYKIEIEARGFENWSRKVEVIEPIEVHANLIAAPKAVLDHYVGGARDGLESISPFETIDALLPALPDGAELEAGKQGRLMVRTRDYYARVEVFDVAGKLVKAAWGQLDTTLPVGTYRVTIALPTERPLVQSVLVTADEPEVIDVRPDPQLTRLLPPSAGAIQPHDGVSQPSEVFGVVTTTHLGSLLAWAAWAAQFPADGPGRKLRQLGVEPLEPALDKCFVRILVGNSLPPGANPGVGPIDNLKLEVSQQPVALNPVPALAGFAVQGQAPVPQYGASLTVEAGGLDPKRIPLPFIPGHVWTIVIVRESTQLTEIHRYLQRLQAQGPFDDTIRLVEQNWRALEARTPLYDDEAARLLGRNPDPLSLAVLGYRLALENRWPKVAEVVERLAPVAPVGLTGLADVCVLAALVGERDKNMKLAVTNSSVPVVGEGYRLMAAWLAEHFEKQNMPPPIAPEPFIGGVWTTFDTRGQAVISKAFPVHNVPAWAIPLIPAANATAKIEVGPENPKPLIGTGFLIGPRALVVTDIIANEKPQFAVFNGKRLKIQEVVGATNDDRHGALVRIEPVEQVPLKIRWALQEVGTRIAVIGHPLITFQPTFATLAAFMTYPAGQKMIMPGVIVSVEETKLTYECWTLAGVEGGPIIDLATGEVIGIHHSGRYVGGSKKLGFGVPVTAIEALLRTAI